MLEVDISIEPLWGEFDWQSISEKAVSIAMSVTEFAVLTDGAQTVSLSLSFADNAEVQALNRDYREKNKPTNVLSFPMIEADYLTGLLAMPHDAEAPEIMLGDIILAYETCVAEALDKGIPLPDHVTHLIIHGTLHLLGHDHIDDADATIMESLEVKALASMGLGNPYDD